MKILIVDDNKQNLLLLEAMLRGGGHEAVSAGNGIEALEILGKEKVDMIISDILMPGMDGFKLCMKCKEDEKLKATPFIFTTSSYTEAKDEEFGKSLGADAFIVRPIEPENFLKKISEIFGRKKEKKEAAPVELRQKDVGFLEKYSERLASQLEHKIAALEKEITERKRAENALQERVKELKCIGEISQLAEQPGIPLEEFVKKTTALLPPAFQYPEDSCARITMNGTTFTTPNFKETQWDQSANIKVDGQSIGKVTVCYLEEKPLADGGPFSKEEKDLVNVVADLLGHIIQHWRTEKEIRELQEYLQKQINRMPIGLIVWDKEFRAKTWNPAAEKIFGFNAEEAIGKHPYDLIVPKSAQPQVDDIWRRLLAGDETAYSVNENITKDGRTITCDWSNTPLRGADGKAIGALSMVQDITARKQAEEEMRKRLEELEIFHKATTGRELKMMELEKEVNTLLRELGKEPKYKGIR